MNEMLTMMEQLCKDSLRSIIVGSLMLLPIQYLLAVCYPTLDSFLMVVLPFLLIFALLNLIHARRCRTMIQQQAYQRYQLLPIKNYCVLLSEWLFTSASYLFLLFLQYISWFLIYQQLKSSFPMQSNTFYFFSLSQLWLHPLMSFQFFDLIKILLLLAMLALNFTFLHMTLALKNYRGLSILLTSVCCILVIALALSAKGHLPLLGIMVALTVFAFLELCDLLGIRRGGQPYEKDK